MASLDVQAHPLGLGHGQVDALALEDDNEVRSNGRSDPFAVLRGEGRAEWSAVVGLVVRFGCIAEAACLEEGTSLIYGEGADILETTSARADVPCDALKAPRLALATLGEAARGLNLVVSAGFCAGGIPTSDIARTRA